MATLFSAIRGCDSYVFVSADLSFTVISRERERKNIRAHSKVGVVLFCLAGRGWLLRCGGSRHTDRYRDYHYGPRTQNVLGESDHHIRELNAVVKKRFIELNAELVATRSLCAIAQAESLCYKLIGGLAVCRACYGVLRFIMESCAKGYEVVVSGKLRGQRAKSMKFVDGMMIHSDDLCKEYTATATPGKARKGELGIQVKIMLPWDLNGNIGPKEPLSDNVEMVEPKNEIMYNTPRSEPKNKPSALKLGAGRTIEVVEPVIS